jgi:SnoaL-like domain
VSSCLTEGASVEHPPGSAVRADAMSALIDGRAMAPFRRTHHVTTNYVIDPEGDRAAVRFNLIATHPEAPPSQGGSDRGGQPCRDPGVL